MALFLMRQIRKYSLDLYFPCNSCKNWMHKLNKSMSGWRTVYKWKLSNQLGMGICLRPHIKIFYVPSISFVPLILPAFVFKLFHFSIGYPQDILIHKIEKARFISIIGWTCKDEVEISSKWKQRPEKQKKWFWG